MTTTVDAHAATPDEEAAALLLRRTSHVSTSDPTLWNWDAAPDLATVDCGSLSYFELRQAFSMAMQQQQHERERDLGDAGDAALGVGGVTRIRGGLLEAIAATVLQCAARRLIARRLIARLQAARRARFEAECSRDLEELSTIVIQTLLRRARAARAAAARRPAFGNDALSRLGIARSRAPAVAANPSGVAASSAAVPPSSSNDGDGGAGGYGFMQECAAGVIQTWFRGRRRRCPGRAAAPQSELLRPHPPATPSATRARAPAVSAAADGEMECETTHLPLSATSASRADDGGAPARFPTRIRNQTAGPSRLGWGDSRGDALTAVFADATELTLRQLREEERGSGGGGKGEGLRSAGAAARASLWGIRALHAAAVQVKSSSFLAQLRVSRWIEGPLGRVLPATASLATAPHQPESPLQEAPR